MSGPEITRGRRRDAVRSRDALLIAVAALLAEQGPGFSLTDVATRAGVSAATAYRHFASPDEAIGACYHQLSLGLIEAFDAIPDDLAAAEQLHRLGQVWVTQAASWGPAAVYLRSPRGYLARLDDGDPFIAALNERLTAVLGAAIEAGFLPDQDLRYATLLWVTLFDERVIVDLTHSHRLSPAAAASRLTGTLLAALGYSEPTAEAAAVPAR
jgi:AcrR family transcriptional regulator